MGNGPQTATFLDWGKRDWLKNMKKINFTNTQFKPSLSFSIFFKMVSGGWINRAIHYQGEERKGKSCLFKGYWAWEKGWGGSLLASRAGSLFLRAVWRQKERERLWLSSLAPRQSASTDWQFRNAMICYICPRQCRENLKSITMQ